MYEPWTPSWSTRTRKSQSSGPPSRTTSPAQTPSSPSPLTERTLNSSSNRSNLKRSRNQEELRAMIRGLSASERAQKLHDMVTVPSQLFDSQSKTIQSPQPLDSVTTLGCSHYERAVQASAPCCDRFFTCRFCHDEACDHKLDRKRVDRLRCMRCGHVQAFGTENACLNCHKTFARYFCAECRFFDDAKDKPIFHCSQCDVCRVGLRQDYFHCEGCSVCISVDLRGKHKCVERSLESACPVCAEYLATSTQPVRYFSCGHAMHDACFDEYRKSNYVCPICSKSLGDMHDYFERVDQIMKHSRMPPDFVGVKAKIFCADCEQRSVVNFHYMFHKCAQCGSYNTKMLERFRS